MSQASIEKFGFTVSAPFGFDLVFLAEEAKLGRWFLVATERQEIEIRITPSGLLRVSKPRKRGPLKAGGF